MDPKQYEAVVDVEAEDASGGFEPIPEDTYLVKVTETKFEPTKKGAPMYTLTLDVVDGEFKGRKLWHRRPVMPPNGEKKGTLGFVKADTQALGIHLNRGKAGEVTKQVVREALGKLVQARVGFGTGDYANRNEVKALLPADAADVFQATPGLTVREEDL